MTDIPLRFVENVLSWEDDAVYEEGRQYRRDLAPGSASWIGGGDGNPNAALDFTCPCGCGSVHVISVSVGEKKPHHWLWNGNIEKPTLTPSIQCLTPCRWHGFLTDGVFKQC